MALHLCIPSPIGLHALVTSKPVPKKILSPNWMGESRDPALALVFCEVWSLVSLVVLIVTACLDRRLAAVPHLVMAEAIFQKQALLSFMLQSCNSERALI